MHVFEEHLADEYHQDERWQHQREGGCRGAQHGHDAIIAGIVHSHIAAVGGRVDADGPRRHLTDGHDVGELCCGEPVVMDDGLCLNERQHTVASTEPEESDFEEGEEKLQVEQHHSVGLRK